jgi:hypothetical protein
VDRARKVVAPLVALSVGFAAGAASGIRKRTVTETRTVTREAFPAACGRALTLAGENLGLAQQSIALGRAASQAAAPAPPSGPGPSGTGPAASASEAMLGEAMSRLLFAQRQYLEARSACEAAITSKQLGAASPAPTQP